MSCSRGAGDVLAQDLPQDKLQPFCFGGQHQKGVGNTTADHKKGPLPARTHPGHPQMLVPSGLWSPALANQTPNSLNL